MLVQVIQVFSAPGGDKVYQLVLVGKNGRDLYSDGVKLDFPVQ